MMKRAILALLFCVAPLFAVAQETWQGALSRMPLAATNVSLLTRTNCVPVMLAAFQSNDVVKALIFMPGATDEFYMFRRARATLTNASPSLLDAVIALTNQTYIRATFHAPLLLLHTDEYPIDPLIEIKDAETVTRLQKKSFVPHGIYNDRDWDFMLPIMRRKLGVTIHPGRYSYSSWHFYRHSFACWNLNGWEAVQAICLADKTTFTVERKRLSFGEDTRVLAQPKL